MSVVTPFPDKWERRQIATFERKEVMKILDLYGRMVAAGHWRDRVCAASRFASKNAPRFD